MEVLIVLIPVDITARKVCETIENAHFTIKTKHQPTKEDILDEVSFRLGLNAYNDKVMFVSDFMNMFNDQELNPDDYYMSYVYVE